MKRQRIVILGSTGSIGQSTLEVIAHLSGEFEVAGLAAGRNWQALAAQAQYWKPRFIAIADPADARSLQSAVGSACTVVSGADAPGEMIEQSDCDCVVVAVVGVAALSATLRAVELGKKVALANKESLVVGGSLIMPLAEKRGAGIIPVDSEHSAIFQVMQAGRPEDVSRIFLTASGGPFRTWSAEQMATAQPQQALDHPTWEMGPKITIDSATMMNKALEIIEARWLFGLRHDQIEVIIHPESIVHSLVEFRDGSMVAQLSSPDMRTPIQYALTYPQRRSCPADRLCLSTLGRMTFEPPDPQRFPSLQLGHEVAASGGSSGAVLNAANEQANELYRNGRIGFADIVELTRRVVDKHTVISEPTLDDLLRADAWARQETLQLADKCRVATGVGAATGRDASGRMGRE